MNRRDFLKASLATGALYSASGLPFLGGNAYASGFASLNNRVLVNVMLQGGPDLRHLMPPAFNSNPASYGYRYWQAKARAHSIADTASAYQARWENDYFHLTHGQTQFGILKSSGWLKRMWDSGNVAVICNAIGARSRDHAHCQLVLDQGNIASGPNDFNRSGWGGRLAAAAGGNVLALTRAPRRFCYGPDAQNPEGHTTANLVAAKNTRRFNFYQPDLNDQFSPGSMIARSLKSYYAARRNELAEASTYYRTVDLERTIRAFGDQIDERLSYTPLPLAINNLVKGNGISNSYLGEQIRNLYDSLAANDILSLRVASLEYGSWDSHKDQRSFIEPKFQDMFGDGKVFDVLYQSLPANVKDNLVLVFAGEFGRQIRANGGNGCDHGKGNSVLVIGNKVKGGVYGNMFPESELARLEVVSADIDGLTEFDHILGRVADWVLPGSGNVVFPNRPYAAIEPGVNLGGLFV
jgi:uncharacterized protein (DUF1501 family)